MAELRFDGSSGRKPSAEARRYVYGILAAILEHELTDADGWVFGGIELDADRRRLVRAVRLVRDELRRKQLAPNERVESEAK